MPYVTELRPADVLFGRGSGPNDHEGNIHFRQLVAQRKQEYMATSHRMTKAKIAKEIVESVLKLNGRFLKKIESKEAKQLGIPEGVDTYEMADQETVMEKAKQALRQNTNKHKDPPSKLMASNAAPAPDKLPSDSIGHSGSSNNAGSRPGQNFHVDLEPIPFSQLEGGVAGRTGSQQYAGSSLPPQVQEVNPPQWHVPSVNARVPDVAPSYYAEPNSDMVSYLPVNARSFSAHSSMEDLPDDDQMDSRRGSMTVNDLYRSRNQSANMQSMQMSDLMDSFSRMKASNSGSDEQRRMMASTDTMGTIEPINAGGSVADMSLGTVNSSTFSIFKGNDSLLSGEGSDKFASPPERSMPIMDPPSSSGGAYRSSVRNSSAHSSRLASESSISISDFNNARRKSSSFGNSLGGASLDQLRESGSTNLAEHPRPVALMEGTPDPFELDGMGQSSMSVLKTVLAPTNEEGRTDTNDHHPSHHYTPPQTSVSPKMNTTWRRDKEK